MQKQKQEEEYLKAFISRLHCLPERLQPHLADLIPSKLITRVRKEFYNPNVLEMATCILYSIFGISGSQIPVNERIRHWFQDLEQIGAESVEGYAMRADFQDVEDTFILKAPRDPNEADLLHELFIGLYGTNRLRNILPNFAYLFGGFQCSAPIIQPKTQVVGNQVIRRDEVNVVSYCEDITTDTVPYVIYENISPAVSMAKYVQTCSGPQFMLAFIGIILALRRAWLSIGFVHNDLHTENVLIRNMGERMSIPYSTPWGIRFITTDQIPTIIDFGRSRIRYRDVGYGFSGMELVAIFEDFPLPIIDVYKLLLFSYEAMINAGNWSCFNYTKSIAAYFIPGLKLSDPNYTQKLVNIISEEREIVYYYIDLREGNNLRLFQRFIRETNNPNGVTGVYPERWLRAYNFTFDAFLNYLRTSFNLNTTLTLRPEANLAYCHGKGCGSKAEILNSFFERPLNQIPTAEDFYEFYDLYTYTKTRAEVKTRIKADFNRIYPRAKDDYLMHVLDQLNIFRDLVIEIDPNLRILNKDLTYIANLAEQYREKVTQIADAVSHWEDLKFYFQIGNYIADVYQDTDLHIQIQDLEQQTMPYRLALDRYKEQTFVDARYWNTKLRDPTFLMQAQDESILEWMHLVFPKVAEIINA